MVKNFSKLHQFALREIREIILPQIGPSFKAMLIVLHLYLHDNCAVQHRVET